MSGLKQFLKQNKKAKDNIFYPASKDFVDEKGDPILWELKALSTKEFNKIKELCTIEVQITGKPNQFRQKMDANLLNLKMTTQAVVSPNLYDKELQDSYDVMSPEELLEEMLDDVGEYNGLVQKTQELTSLVSMDEKVEEAKN